MSTNMKIAGIAALVVVGLMVLDAFGFGPSRLVAALPVGGSAS